MARWRDGEVARWRSGEMHFGTSALRHFGTSAPRHPGTPALRASPGTISGVERSVCVSAESATLVTRTAQGDREAFAALYRRHRPDVYRFAAHMTGTTAAVEDIVQDVFLAVFVQAQRFDQNKGDALAWLMGITRNHVRRWQHRRRWLSLTGFGDAVVPEPAVTSDPMAALTRAEDEARLSRALLQVPTRFREVIVLCDLQDFSYEDAARALGCAVGTVRSRLHRGRTRLAHALEHDRAALVCRPSPTGSPTL